MVEIGALASMLLVASVIMLAKGMFWFNVIGIIFNAISRKSHWVPKPNSQLIAFAILLVLVILVDIAMVSPAFM